MRTTLVAALLWACVLAPLRAEEPAAGPPMADRARILAVELRRGPAADLAPYLAPTVDPALRGPAIRALGRIGDRAGASEWLLKLLGGPDPMPVQVLEAAGLSAARALEGAVATHLASKDVPVVAAAVAALGWIGGESAASRVAAMLHAKEPVVRTAALNALARCRQEPYLERVLRFVDDREERVREAAAFAAWMLAGARKKAALAQDDAWAGDADLAALLLPGLLSAEPERRLNALRPLGLLAPKDLPDGSPLGDAVARLVKDPDARVVEELIARVLTSRPGPGNAARLAQLLAHPDPKVREAAVEALGAHGTPEAVAPLKARGEVETDDAVRLALAAALVRAGRADDIGLLLVPVKPGFTPADVQARTLRAMSGWKDPKALASLVGLARANQERPPLLLEALDALGELEGPALKLLVVECLAHSDAYVRAAAVGLAAKKGFADLRPAIDALYRVPEHPGERDLPQAVVEAWALFAKAAAPGGVQATALRVRLLEAARAGPTFTARAAAIMACNELGIEGAPSVDALQPNDWQGLPRPKEPVLGLDLSKGTGWLTEAEILALADRLASERAEFVVETSVGLFRLAVDPSEAPVHAVAFLLNVHAGTYDGTPWHRVVPSFVIQGGDPHGTGNGDAGYGLPDEITRAPFVRGALGMPKGDIRDTGGCQLFVMHSPYRPLDGRYTCYGRVVDGMDTVDRIRVGDRIRSIRQVQPTR